MASSATLSTVLVPEIVGFVPQFLLDDIVNTANDAVGQAVDAMEMFLRRWAAEREEKVGGDWDSTQEVEQGLVAFQTLLNSHVDIAFDFFEAWSLRNIFAVPPDLPIVAPHHAKLNLEHPPEKEAELVEEIKDLRAKIQAQRKLQRLLTLAVHKSAAQRARSEKRLQRLSFLRSPQLQSLMDIPEELLAMYDTVSSLPPHDSSSTIDQLNVLQPEPGKRLWETNRTGYINWALQQLATRARDQQGDTAAVQSVSAMHGIGQVEDMKAVAEVINETVPEPEEREDGMVIT